MLRCARMITHSHCLALLMVLLLLGSFGSGFAQGSAIASRTTSDHKKSNQNKVFYHDGKWWAVAYDSSKTSWYLWRFDDPAWVASRVLQSDVDNHLDVLVDSTTNKLYVISSHATTSRFRRFSYSAGAWNLDAGFPVAFASTFTNPNGNNPINLVKAKNGELWLFRVNANKLQAKRSTDDGATWGANQTIKSLGKANGITDAVAFSNGVDNFIGVAYGEAGSATSLFGFLRHRDGDAISTWTDETTSLTYFGSERGHNELAMTVDANNIIYLFTRTFGGVTGNPRNTLYMRSAAGAWTPFIVNAIGGRSWLSPAVAVDQENQRIFVFGVNQNNNRAEYRVGVLGGGSDLQTSPIFNLFLNGSDVFKDLSTPAHAVNAVTGLMVTAGDTTAKDTWFNRLTIPATAPLLVPSVALNNNIVNANASDTLTLRNSAGGALAANFSTITVRFPDNTFVPAVITPGNISVNGTPVTAASSNPVTREITLTTPVKISNNTKFTVVFSAALGLLNPTLPGSYTVQAWTSQQPTPVTSPSLLLIGTTTTISSVKVMPFPTDVDSAAQYTVGFRVGAYGRLYPDSSKITIYFADDTKVTAGALTGVTVNGAAASATGDNANRRIDVKVPAAVTISNNDSVTVFIPALAVMNPSRADTFTVEASTTVETTKVTSNSFYIQKGRRIAGTTKNFERGNQSKMFYHDGAWWLAAQSKANNSWYLWRRTSTDTTWTQTTLIHNQGKSRPDCIVDAANNRVYILLPGNTNAFLTRLSYASGSWTVDSGYPKTVITLQEKHMNLARAINEDLWVFWYADSTIYARRSTNDGSTWSATVVVKDSLNTKVGLQDAVAFSDESGDWIGVGYAENNAPNSVFGFLRHEDDADIATWLDESASVPQFSGTTADDHISMLTHNNEVFMAVKTAGGGGNTTAQDGLLHRATNGDWNAYPIINDDGWTRPVLAIDTTNGMLYAFGTREGSIEYVESKKVALGSYGSLESAPIDTLMHYHGDDFFDVSTPAHVVDGNMNLLIAASNQTRNETWVQYLDLPGIVVAVSQLQPSQNAAALQAAASNDEIEVGAFPNPFNPSTQIQFTLKTAAPVKLQIFNVNGQLIRTLVDNDLPAGAHRRMWRGVNQNGEPVSSGTYFYRLQVGGLAKTGQLYMIK